MGDELFASDVCTAIGLWTVGLGKGLADAKSRTHVLENLS
jgi:hypothetical protein